MQKPVPPTRNRIHESNPEADEASENPRDAELVDTLLDLATDLVAPGIEEEDDWEELSQLLGAVRAEVSQCREKLASLTEELVQLRTADGVVADLREECRKSREQFHEREVLRPMFLALIQIADRSRRQVQDAKRGLHRAEQRNDVRGKKLYSHLLEARKADCCEVEDLLARYSVEGFRHSGDTFNPSHQKCIKRVACQDPQQAGRIADRVLPGYRRDGTVIRAEYVNVYVSSGPQDKTSGGEP